MDLDDDVGRQGSSTDVGGFLNLFIRGMDGVLGRGCIAAQNGPQIEASDLNDPDTQLL